MFSASHFLHGNHVPDVTGQCRLSSSVARQPNLKAVWIYLHKFSLFLAVQFSSVQSLSRVRLCDPMTAACQASLSITNSQSLPKLTSIDLVMPSKHLILCHPLLLLPLLSQHQGLLKRVSSSHQVPKYWSFSFNISPSNEHSGLISFRMDWLDLFEI